MASPAGQFRPWRLITAFVIVTAVLYALVFFTKGSNAPKLGIDLQGGTQITLTAETLDGKAPSSSSMQQAQQIMVRRVNGSGVAGAQVQIDGSNQLVVTVPGNNDLPGLTASARLNIRPHVAQGYDYALVSAATATTTGAKASGAATSGAASSVPALSGAATSKAGETVAGQSAPATSAQGLRAGAAATTGAATKPAATKPAATKPAATKPAATKAATALATPTTAPSTPKSAGAAASSAPASSGAAASGAVSSGAVSSGAVSSGAAASSAAVPPKSAWPIAGSDPANPNQPLAKDATGWTAWLTAAQTAVTNSTVSCADIKKKEGQDDLSRPLLACGSDSDTNLKAAVFLLGPTLIPGDQISGATAGLDQTGSSGWVINVTFDSAGFKTWSTYTANNVGKQTAFTLDGVVISDPSISGPINTVTTLITGTFTQASATSLANSLNFGALPLNFVQGTSTSISAELGFQYLQAGLIAGGIGLLLVIVYCIAYYRLLGLITIGSLVLSGGLVYAIMVLLGRWIDLSLDLAGVAGLIVAIGITADSFVIYFERLKDEVREGRTFRSAVPRGWERAKRTILSADAVSFLSAIVLYLVAVGDVKGFAFTLGLSTVLDLVVVYLVTHPLVALASGSKIFNSARYSGLGAVAAAGARQRAATARLTAKEA
ncbi:preprotein translocase subunit SecD [Nakamurella sp. UYEF19]|uniref:protein translocase subunit SecD n=1 Tax=Nakamurella sp. UYEF19 TaxID=1756392 RepID=UPI0033944EFB